jgi:aminopeptidase YwaD
MRRSLVGLALLLLACRPTTPTTQTPSPTGTAVAPLIDPWQDRHVDREQLRAHLAFLADDAQEGRAPGTPGDARSQAHVAAAFTAAGLEPAFADGYCQSFTVTDGVRLRDGQSASLRLGTTEIPTTLLPFAHATDAPITAPLVYIGHGILDEKDDPALHAAIKGSIVVVRAGAPDDPHLDPTRTRTQSKLIAARDHGAVGFILLDPDSDLPFPNHGEASDLQIPALAVGKAGTAALRAAFKGRRAPPKAPPGYFFFDPKNPWRSAPVSLHTPIERITRTTCNMGALLPGSSPKRIVVGAHMDHLGLGTAGSLAPGQQAIHNGADDNASGVATLLALATALAKLPREARPYTIEFLAFGAEEMGLLGSRHFVESLTPEARARLITMLNFDMVGRLQNNSLVVSGVGTSSAWPKLLEQAAGALQIRPSEDGFGASDQASFYAAGLPVLHFFSGTHSDYHKPSDDLDKINFDGAAAIGDVALRLIATLMREQPALDFIKVATPTAARGGFRVSLGTVPDYAAKVDGVQLADVRAGGPAAAAGLQAGDIITRLGARDIHNFDDYMASFGELKPGVAVPVKILRAGAVQELTLTPAAPARH